MPTLKSRVLSSFLVCALVMSSLLGASAQASSAFIIGDSLSVGEFGESFFKCLKDSGKFTQMRAETSCGSRINHWTARQPSYKSTCGYAQRLWSKGQSTVKKNESRQTVVPLAEMAKGYTIYRFGANEIQQDAAEVLGQFFHDILS